MLYYRQQAITEETWLYKPKHWYATTFCSQFNLFIVKLCLFPLIKINIVNKHFISKKERTGKEKPVLEDYIYCTFCSKDIEA